MRNCSQINISIIQAVNCYKQKPENISSEFSVCKNSLSTTLITHYIEFEHKADFLYYKDLSKCSS